MMHAQNNDSQQEQTQQVWIPPLRPAGVADIRTPFPSMALGTFAGAQAVFQNVEWGGLTGFDDEGQTRVNIPADTRPEFLILQLPDSFEWDYGGRHTSSLPLLQRGAAMGGSVPAVNPDPSLPGYDVSAAYVFPADDATGALFDSAPDTRNNNRLIRYVNFSRGRWVRPEDISVLRRLH